MSQTNKQTLAAFPELVHSGAYFSEDRKYRFSLTRIWDSSKPVCAWIGLNPSRADEERSDPTVTREIRFSLLWGYGGYLKLNLFNLISPYPLDLLKTNDLYRSDGSVLHVIQPIRTILAKRVVAAWGTHSNRFLHDLIWERSNEIRYACRQANIPLSALGFNKDMSPKHPLYLPSYTSPVEYSGAPRVLSFVAASIDAQLALVGLGKRIIENPYMPEVYKEALENYEPENTNR